MSVAQTKLLTQGLGNIVEMKSGSTWAIILNPQGPKRKSVYFLLLLYLESKVIFHCVIPEIQKESPVRIIFKLTFQMKIMCALSTNVKGPSLTQALLDILVPCCAARTCTSY